MPAGFRSDSFRFNTKGIFEGLSAESLQRLDDASVTHSYKKGEIVFREGGIPSGIFYLVRGKVKKYKTTGLATKSVRERVALNLLILDEKFKREEKQEASGEINMSRADLANMVGTAKESLVRLLRQFKSEGLIESNGRIIRILNKKGIIREANLSGGHAKVF